jgi:putative flippase GtrA
MMTRSNKPLAEITRYVINGLVATLVHYAFLNLNLLVLHMPSAGLANLAAALFGIACSFLGNRYWVFRKLDVPFSGQAMKFGGLYAAIALLHGGILFVWTDLLSQDYRIGFLIATLIQFSLSYVGNKFLVFNR